MADPQFITGLEETLKMIISPNTSAIKAASTKLQTEFYFDVRVVPAFIHILQNHPQIEIRQLAGVEVRKLIDTFWGELDDQDEDQVKLSPDAMNSIRSSILQSTLHEQNALVRHTSSRVISQIAKFDVDEGKWNELLPFLYQTSKSTSAAQREVAVYIIYTLLESGVQNFIDGSVELLHLFSQTINDPESLQVRVSTVLGLGQIADNIDSGSINSKTLPKQQNPIELFRALLPSAVEVLKQVISADDEKSALQIFDIFNGFLFVDSVLISKHLKDLISFMLTNIAAERQLSDEFRLPALQFLYTAIKLKKNKIQSLKLGPILMNTALQIASEPFDEDEEEEKTTATGGDDDEDDEDDNDDNTPAKRALRIIDILSSSLPPTQAMGPLLAALPHCSASSDPFQRRAGFLALSHAVEGSPDFVANQMDSILPIVISGLRDNKPIVIVSALMALSQLAGELHDVIGAHHEELLPLVFNIMDSATSLKVAKSACLALDAILETLDSKVITEKYLPELVPKLLHLLNVTADLTLKGSIVAAIASAAFAAGKFFEPFFVATISAFEPFIRVSVTSETITENELTLCGITLDALSSLAGAVGKETFSPYVQPLVEAAYKCLQSSQSRLKECGFIFLGTLAKIYETDFAPFLDMVVPQIFATLDQDEFTTGEDAEDDNDDMAGIGGDDDDEDLLNNFKVNSALAVEKEIAIDTLGELIVGTKEHFTKYLEKSIEHLIESTEHFYDGIRTSALIALWRAYITFYKLSVTVSWQPGYPSTVVLPEPAATVAKVARESTLKLFTDEDERSVVTSICDNIVEAIRTGGPVILGSQDELEQICSEVILILSKSHPCQVQDFDDDEYDAANDDENDDGLNAEYDDLLIDSALDVVIQLAASMGSQFIPLFPTFLGLISKLCSSKSSQERASAIGALAEIINGMKGGITPWTKELMAVLLHSLGDSNLEVRSNAAYGVGLLILFSEDAEVSKSQYIPVLQKLQRLLKKVDKKHRKSLGGDDENDNSARSLANACGCVARMSTKYPGLVPLGEVVPVLVSKLPLQDGLEENTPIFEFIIKLFEQREASVIELREHIVEIFGQVFEQQLEIENDEKNKPFHSNPAVKPFEDDEIKTKVIHLLKFLEQEQPGLVSSRPTLSNILA